MCIEQDRERAHIEEQMKHFKGVIEIIPTGMIAMDKTFAQKSYIESTKKGAKKAHQTRDKERSKHYPVPVRVC